MPVLSIPTVILNGVKKIIKRLTLYDCAEEYQFRKIFASDAYFGKNKGKPIFVIHGAVLLI